MTRRLDRAVVRLARWLSGRAAWPVQIRFNSDRLSGGAFAAPPAKDGARRPEIGLTARIIMPKPDAGSRPPCTEATPLRYAALIDRSFLRDPSGIGAEESFGWWRADTPAEARRILERMSAPGIVSASPRSPENRGGGA